MLEYRRHRYAQLRFALETSHNSNGQERVPTEVKEVVRSMDAITAKDFLPNFCEEALCGGRRLVFIDIVCF